MTGTADGQGLTGTAGAYATPNVPRAAPASTAAEVCRAIEGLEFDSLEDVAVLEGERLVGLVPIERLMAARPETRLSDLVRLPPAVVSPATDQERAAALMAHGGDGSLAVVDEAGRFHGLIPPRRMLAVLAAEHEEDVARLGGFLSRTSQARTAAEEGVARRLWHRLPWLLVGLGGAMAAAAIVGSFEAELERTVLLAFFVPGVVYMADAVGTQTEALIIRGIAVGVPVRHILRRELTTGAVIGVVVAATFLPFAWAVWEDADVAVAVSIALFSSCSTATVVAMGLPYLLHRLGRDPAFGSGPLATVIQDLLSIVIYFAVALAVVG